jgi:hypothetical protein
MSGQSSSRQTQAVEAYRTEMDWGHFFRPLPIFIIFSRYHPQTDCVSSSVWDAHRDSKMVKVYHILRVMQQMREAVSLALVFFLQRNYEFNCDRFSELLSRIVNDVVNSALCGLPNCLNSPSIFFSIRFFDSCAIFNLITAYYYSSGDTWCGVFSITFVIRFRHHSTSPA